MTLASVQVERAVSRAQQSEMMAAEARFRAEAAEARATQLAMLLDQSQVRTNPPTQTIGFPPEIIGRQAMTDLSLGSAFDLSPSFSDRLKPQA